MAPSARQSDLGADSGSALFVGSLRGQRGTCAHLPASTGRRRRRRRRSSADWSAHILPPTINHQLDRRHPIWPIVSPNGGSELRPSGAASAASRAGGAGRRRRSVRRAGRWRCGPDCGMRRKVCGRYGPTEARANNGPLEQPATPLLGEPARAGATWRGPRRGASGALAAGGRWRVVRAPPVPDRP